MSRAFLKNETADDPVVIPARAPLPPGATNYVTPRGLVLLHAELVNLEAERAQVQTRAGDETERTRQLAELNGRVGLLNGRIASAKVVGPPAQLPDQNGERLVRFGATVTLRTRTKAAKGSGAERRLTIVGVDEADASHGRIAFTAPIAQAMQGKRVGETVTLRTARGEDVMDIVGIDYEA